MDITDASIIHMFVGIYTTHLPEHTHPGLTLLPPVAVECYAWKLITERALPKSADELVFFYYIKSDGLFLPLTPNGANEHDERWPPDVILLPFKLSPPSIFVFEGLYCFFALDL